MARWHIKFRSCVSTTLIRVPQGYQLASRYVVETINVGQGMKDYAILVSCHMIKSLAAKHARNQNYWSQKSLAVHHTLFETTEQSCPAGQSAMKLK